MRSFTILWLGQILSLIGSAMTWFAFTIWAWDVTGKASALATISFFAFLPAVLFSPVAGAFVDRWNRKLVMLLSDLATALGTLTIFLIYTFGELQIWHIYLVSILAGFFTAFQYPAYAAAVTTMLSKQDYARAEGMLGSARALSGILAPVFAAALLGVIGLSGIMLIDLATFLFAFGTLLIVHVPNPKGSAIGLQSRGMLWEEIAFGFRYIKEQQGLRALTVLFMSAGIFLAIGATLMAPLVLSGTENDESALATVQSTGAIGGVAGGVLLSLWGGTKRRVLNILIGGAAACLLGIFWLGVSHTVLLWAVGSFFFAFFEPFVEGGNLAIWQVKVPADVQGRVFSARHLLVQIPYLFGILASGYLAEARTIPVVLSAAGIIGALVFGAGYFFREVHDVETLYPDAQET
ncbi:MAG: MFS transporter [Anaerolineales bacterium]|nr:MFS transporter [Anaerolineae bacterium]PWB69787.1 MAG: MFS transporter [Anaerolineales bacterium]